MSVATNARRVAVIQSVEIRPIRVIRFLFQLAERLQASYLRRALSDADALW
jgi:hypothetical protein